MLTKKLSYSLSLLPVFIVLIAYIYFFGSSKNSGLYLEGFGMIAILSLIPLAVVAIANQAYRKPRLPKGMSWVQIIFFAGWVYSSFNFIFSSRGTLNLGHTLTFIFDLMGLPSYHAALLWGDRITLAVLGISALLSLVIPFYAYIDQHHKASRSIEI